MSPELSCPPQSTPPSSTPGPGCVLGLVDSRGQGVFAIRPYRAGEVVVAGDANAEFPRDSHPLRQSSVDRALLAGSLIGKVAHSCCPNCGVRLNAAGNHDLVARYDIRAGTEITTDFAMRSFSIDLFPEHCGCKTVGCRGRITGFGSLPLERKRAYYGLVAPHLLDLERAENRRLQR